MDIKTISQFRLKIEKWRQNLQNQHDGDQPIPSQSIHLDSDPQPIPSQDCDPQPISSQDCDPQPISSQSIDIDCNSRSNSPKPTRDAPSLPIDLDCNPRSNSPKPTRDAPSLPIPHINWEIESVGNVTLLIDQESRVRQMLRTKTLQLKLETEIRNYYNSRIDMDTEFKAAKHRQTRMLLEEISGEFVEEMEARENEIVQRYQNKINKLKNVMREHAELSDVMQIHERLERKTKNFNAAVTSTAEKYVEICKWRAVDCHVSNINKVKSYEKGKRDAKEKYDALHHQLREKVMAESLILPQTMYDIFTRQTQLATQKIEQIVNDKLLNLDLHVQKVQDKVKRAKASHMSSVELMVSDALHSRNTQKIEQLSIALSPNVSPRFGLGGPNRSRKDNNGRKKGRRFSYADADLIRNGTTLKGNSFAPVISTSSIPSTPSTFSQEERHHTSKKKNKKKKDSKTLLVVDVADHWDTSTPRHLLRGITRTDQKDNIPDSTRDRTSSKTPPDQKDKIEDVSDVVDSELSTINAKYVQKLEKKNETSDFDVSKEHIGKIVWVQCVKSWGTIRYFGNLPSSKATGEYVGISLSLPKGLNE